MSAEFWAIIGIGIVVWLTLLKLSERLERTNRLLESIAENTLDLDKEREKRSW